MLSAELTQLSRSNASFYFIYFYIASVIVGRHFPEAKLQICLLKICRVERQKRGGGQRRKSRQKKNHIQKTGVIKGVYEVDGACV